MTILAVCDGMGGEASGKVASLIAVTALREGAERIASAASRGEADAAVQEYVSRANGRLCGAMRESVAFSESNWGDNAADPRHDDMPLSDFFSRRGTPSGYMQY